VKLKSSVSMMISCRAAFASNDEVKGCPRTRLDGGKAIGRALRMNKTLKSLRYVDCGIMYCWSLDNSRSQKDVRK